MAIQLSTPKISSLNWNWAWLWDTKTHLKASHGLINFHYALWGFDWSLLMPYTPQLYLWNFSSRSFSCNILAESVHCCLTHPCCCFSSWYACQNLFVPHLCPSCNNTLPLTGLLNRSLKEHKVLYIQLKELKIGSHHLCK